MNENPLVHRIWLGFVGLNAAFVTYLGLATPLAMDEKFTWAELPPLHARFVGGLYLFGAVLLLGSVVCRRWTSVAPVIAATAIFTTSMLVLTLLNWNAFDFDLTGPMVWTVAYFVFSPISIVLAIAYRKRQFAEPDDGPTVPGWLSAGLRVLVVVFGCAGVGLLVGRSVFADLWPWKVTDGVAQFYGGPFLTLAWCAWSYSIRTRLRSLRLYLAAMAALGVSVIAVSVKHRTLFDAADPSAWLWFATFGAIAVGALVAVLSELIPSRASGPVVSVSNTHA